MRINNRVMMSFVMAFLQLADGVAFGDDEVKVGDEIAVLQIEKNKKEWEATWLVLMGAAVKKALGECPEATYMLGVNGLPAEDWLRPRGCDISGVGNITGIQLTGEQIEKGTCFLRYTGVVKKVEASATARSERVTTSVKIVEANCRVSLACEEIKIEIYRNKGECTGLSDLAHELSEGLPKIPTAIKPIGQLKSGGKRNLPKDPAEAFKERK